MTDIIRSIFAEVPWLKTFIAWAIAALVVVLALALPAYYLFLPLTRRLRAELSRYLSVLREHHAQKITQRKDAEKSFLSQYGQDHLLRHLDATSGRLWARTKIELLKLAHDIQARLASVTGSMEGFTRALPRIHERLQAITDGLPKDLQLVATEPGLSQAAGPSAWLGWPWFAHSSFSRPSSASTLGC